MCDSNGSYIVAKGEIFVRSDDNTNRRDKNLKFKNNAPVRSRISKINNTFVDNTEDHDIIMPIYNLLEYSDNYSMTLGSLGNCYRDKVNNDANENNTAGNYGTHKIETTTRKYFECKTKIIGGTLANTNRLDAEVLVPLKYLSNFFRFLNLPLINCEMGAWFDIAKKFCNSEILRTL